MNKVAVSLIVGGALAIAGAGVADAQMKTRTVESTTVTRPSGTMSKVELLKTGKRLDTVSCRDYNMLEETYRPQAIVYGANYGPRGHAHPTVAVDGVERIVPVVTASCRARPGDHFTAAVNRAMLPAR
ncbi:HdeA/HdeB family chaperone [Sphingomonas sp. CROZ-RG-20F-R02-07]|uniref:HdeA/HdeB family chaperone n=1 Tax=Sphingomonas sp. CROZ-RG-20F-R02-07 TaxID=2914832 RepID=UPI001F565E81